MAPKKKRVSRRRLLLQLKGVVKRVATSEQRVNKLEAEMSSVYQLLEIAVESGPP